MFVFQMVHQVVFGFENLLAEVAAVLLVNFPVPGELAALSRRVVAQSTAVGLLSGVRPPVDGQVGDVDEYLAAELTSVPPGYHTALPSDPGLHQGRQGGTVQHQLQPQQADGELEWEALLLHTDLAVLLFFLLLLLVLLLVFLHIVRLLLCDLLCIVALVPLLRRSPEPDPVVLTDVLEEMFCTANTLFTDDTNKTMSLLCNKTQHHQV